MLWWGLACGTPGRVPDQAQPVVVEEQPPPQASTQVTTPWLADDDTGSANDLWTGLVELDPDSGGISPIAPIPGGFITTGVLWLGPVSGDMSVDEAARQTGTLATVNGVAYGDTGFAFCAAEQTVLLFDGDDWSTPALTYQHQGNSPNRMGVDLALIASRRDRGVSGWRRCANRTAA